MHDTSSIKNFPATYLVGGAVRDGLLGLNVTEKDWVIVGSTPDYLIQQGFRQVGKDFPVFLHPDTNEEYALARKERKTGAGYKGFDCYFDPDVTLEEDLFRRDLSINAIAQQADGTLIDPYGGQKDLENRVLRHVSDAFVEDPVRVLRLARFAARFAGLGFQIAPETTELMKIMSSSGDLENLTPERIWKELSRALLESHPCEFFMALRDCQALEIIFPEIDCLFGIPAPAKWHPEIDTGKHTMMVLQEAALLSNELSVRFAALCHDFGKALTPNELLPSHKGHEVAGVAIINTFCARLRVPKNISQLASLTSRFHINCHNALKLSPTSLVNMFDEMDAFRNPERFQQFLLACTADYTGREGWQEKPYEAAHFLLLAFNVAAEVDVKNIIKDGFEGAQIKERLYQLRVIEIKKLSLEQFQ